MQFSAENPQYKEFIKNEIRPKFEQVDKIHSGITNQFLILCIEHKRKGIYIHGYACMCVFICIYTYGWILIFMYMYIYYCMYMFYMYIFVHTHIYTCFQIYIYIYEIYKCTNGVIIRETSQMHIYIYACVYLYLCIYI